MRARVPAIGRTVGARVPAIGRTVGARASTARRAAGERWRSLGRQPPPHAFPVTLYLTRAHAAEPRRLLHVGVSATRPARMRMGGVNGTLVVDERGITWTPGRGVRALGAQPLRVAWASVQTARLVPTFERGVPSRLLSVETVDGGFEMEVQDRYESALRSALTRHEQQP